MVSMCRSFVHVRVTADEKIDLERFAPSGGFPTEQRGLSLAQAADAIRSLPLSHSIFFFDEGRRPASMVALANAALQRSSRRAVAQGRSPSWAATTRTAVPALG